MNDTVNMQTSPICRHCGNTGYRDGGEGSYYCLCPIGRTLLQEMDKPVCKTGACVLPDSGKRQQFVTGAIRDTSTGKGRFDLSPPFAEEMMARHYEAGAAKYDDRNWEKGINLGRMVDSALRHLNKWRQGKREEPHLVSAVWNIWGLIHYLHEMELGRLPKSLDDHNYLTHGSFPAWGYWPEAMVAEESESTDVTQGDDE